MKKFLLGLLFSACLLSPALADSLVVQTCGTLPSAYAAGSTRFDTVDVKGNKCTSGGGGGGGAVTIADGADVTQGTTTDSVCSTDTATCTLIALIKRLNQTLTSANTNIQAPVPGGTNSIGGVTRLPDAPVAPATATATKSDLLGCQYNTADPTFTDSQQGVINCGQQGKLIIQPYAKNASLVSGVTAAMTGTTSTSIIGAPSGSLHNYVTQIFCGNSHATVGTFVLVQDGSGGTTIYEGLAVAAGGGFSITFVAPLRQPTAATALYVQDVTTGANVICSASGFTAL